MENVIVKPVLALRHSNKKGQSLFAKFITTMIKLRTKSKYYHSELILGDKWISSDTPDGVTIRVLREDLDNVDWDYITLPEREITAEQYEDLWLYINMQDGKGYDRGGIILSQLIKIGINDTNKWFCSELVSKILQVIGYPDFLEITPSEQDPGDLGIICNKM